MPLTEITGLLNHYREFSRHIWNAGIRRIDDISKQSDQGEYAENTDDTMFIFEECFENIDAALFDAFVLGPIDRPIKKETRCNNAFGDPIMYLHVLLQGNNLPVMINEPPTEFGYRWGIDDVPTLSNEDAQLRFIGYFDWSSLGDHDMVYCAAQITEFDKHPELVGRTALILTEYVRIYHDEDAN